MSGSEIRELDINSMLRYLGGFAVLIAAFWYSAVVIGAQVILSAGIEKVTKSLYLVGFVGFVLAILAYTVGNEKQAKILYAASIVITSLSLLVVDLDKVGESGLYIVAVLMYMILGIMLLFIFLKEEILPENTRDIIWIGVGAIYLIAIIMQSAFSVGGFEYLSPSDLLIYNYFIPQTLILGGILGIIVAILILLKPILKMVNISEDMRKIVDMALIFSIILGFLYEVYTRWTIYVMGAPGGIFGVLYSFYSIMILGQIFYAILVAALILHIMQKYI